MNEALKKQAEGSETKIKLKDVVNSIEALKILGEQKLPIFTSFKISLFLKNVSPEVEIYEKERNKLMLELGKPDKSKDEKGNEIDIFKFEPEKGKEFTEKLTEILEVELSVNKPDISIKDLGNINIEPRHLVALGWLIKE
jgi:hypothetical protein